MVTVVEGYRDFVPGCNATAVVEDLLASVPEEHVIGLWRIVLTNAGALTGRRKRTWSWSRGRKARHTHVRGLYHHELRGEPAWIELFIDKIEAEYPSWLLRLPVMRSVVFGEVLFHEVGHHIHARHQPEHREREDVADDWKRRLARAHVERRHRILDALLRPLVRIAHGIRRRHARR